MHKRSSIFLVSALLLVCLSSCTIQKRTHTSGYHVQWHLAGKSTENYREQSQIKTELVEESNFINTTEKKNKAEHNHNFYVSLNTEGINNTILADLDSEVELECDTIVFENGERLRAIVLEIGEGLIRYKECDNPRGPTFSIRKSEVYQIIYPNGMRTVIRQSSRPERESPEVKEEEEQKEAKRPDVRYEHRKIDILGLMGFIFASVGFVLALTMGIFFFMGTLAVIFGSISRRNIEKNPNKYKYEWLANAAFYMGVALIILFLIAVLLILLFFGTLLI